MVSDLGSMGLLVEFLSGQTELGKLRVQLC